MALSMVDDDQEVVDLVCCGCTTDASDTSSDSDSSADDQDCSDAYEEAFSVIDDDQEVMELICCGSATDASDTSSDSDSSADDQDCSDADEEAKNLLTILQQKLDREDKIVERFSKVPLSELPILFKISQKVLCSNPAMQTTKSPLLVLPQEVQDMIVTLLEPADAACLASTCKQLGTITHSFAIHNTREYFIRREYLEYGTEMCNGCNKKRPTTEDFWSTDKDKGIITEWFYPFMSRDIDLGHDCTRHWLEECIKEWVERPVAGEEEFTDLTEPSMKSMVNASNKRARTKCPVCRALDDYDLMRLEDELSYCSIPREILDKVMELAAEATFL